LRRPIRLPFTQAFVFLAPENFSEKLAKASIMYGDSGNVGAFVLSVVVVVLVILDCHLSSSCLLAGGLEQQQLRVLRLGG